MRLSTPLFGKPGPQEANGSWAWVAVLQFLQAKFAGGMNLEEGIALNAALVENLFVVVVCILNKIPVFVVGKPGSSKTLAMQACLPPRS